MKERVGFFFNARCFQLKRISMAFEVLKVKSIKLWGFCILEATGKGECLPGICISGQHVEDICSLMNMVHKCV